MIEQIRSFERRISGNTTVFQFDCNHYVKKVTVILTGNFSAYKNSDLTVKYGQNGITTDLISFGIAKVGDSELIEIENDTPVSASHIYVTLDSEIEIKDIQMYEFMSEEVINYYPAVFDTDLKENYFLDTVSVFTSPEGYSHYSIYTSTNGRDFDFLARKNDEVPFNFENGDKFSANGREARIIRVYIEYNTASAEALFDRVEFKGKKSGTPIQNRPEINIPDFKNSDYNVELTENDTYSEIYGIIERRIGFAYKCWFDFKLSENPKGNNCDYFELTDNNGRIFIKGNNGVSLAVGLNHYLKYYCKVNISQVGDQAKMPESIVTLNNKVFRETKAKVRYAYNYCTLSYSMAFFGEKEWRDELDWLALNGVNVVLDATAQEEVWRRFLISLGYTHEEILKFIAGPAYYAWAYMANITGFGGPVHDSWFYERTELARKNHLIMRKLGMHPCLQGYSGMIPNDICEHDPNADIILQGTWCSFDRPTMLRTTSPVFKEYAERFYKAQNEVYGDYSKYFAADPFHEGGNVADMSQREISYEVLSAMLKNNGDSVWIIQSWQSNPTSELLAGINLVPSGKEHALILDLYAEKIPNYNDGNARNKNHGYSPEFDKTPWVFCMLNNFGGRLGLHGHLDNLANWIPEVFNTCSYIMGIGITPEASFNNPVLYDFLFESVWREDSQKQMQVIDLKEWICHYSERRYGAKSISSEKAWSIFLDTVYKSEFNNLGQGAPESIVNARPTLECRSASSWGNAIISYDKQLLIEAAKLIFADFELLKNSNGYKYDLITVLQQILSNKAQDVHLEMAKAFKSKDLAKFEKNAEEFLSIADMMDKVLSGSEYYMLGRWQGQAKALAENADDFTKMLYELNAKSLITTWGSYNQCETGGLHDYSNRQWSGLIRDFYKVRWEKWIAERKKELEGKPFEEKNNWFIWEWNWVRQGTLYDDKPQELELKTLAEAIIRECC